MKTLTVNVQIQFDQFGDEHEVAYAANTIDAINEVLQQRFNDISPLIFNNSIDDDDVCVVYEDAEDD